MNESLDEVDLVRKAQAGDKRAFSTLADRFWEPLRRWLYVLSGKRTDAEDVTQDALLRAWKSLASLKNPGNFRVWLYQIARNLLVDRQRAVREGNSERQPFEVPSLQPGPLEQIIEDEGTSKLAAALKRLPDHYRAAYLLWTQDDWSYQQIAEVIGVTEETARWRVCVARQLLVKELKAYLKL